MQVHAAGAQPATRQVEIVLTDEREIFARTVVIADTDAALQQILAGMNTRRDDAMARGARWREARSYSDTGAHRDRDLGLGGGTRTGFGRDGIPTW